MEESFLLLAIEGGTRVGLQNHALSSKEISSVESVQKKKPEKEFMFRLT